MTKSAPASAVSASPSLPFVDYERPQKTASWNGLILVGEAPGKEEVRQGRPFVGRSGQLLNEMLEAAGLKREESLIANVFRYQPPENKVAHFFLSRRAAKEKGEALAEEWGPFGSAYCREIFSIDIKALKDLLQEKKPRAILGLGRTPLWALTGQSGLLALAGKEVENRLYPSVPVLITYHPSFILRGNWALKDQWLTHFLAAKKRLDGKNILKQKGK